MNNKYKKNKKKFITAYDPKIKIRVPYVVINNIAISLVTKHKFKYKKNINKNKLKRRK